MAAQRSKKSKKQPRSQKPLKTCKRCGRNYAPKRKDQVYCCGTCREADYDDIYGTKPVNKTCKNCGTTFSTTMPKKQDYCGEPCRIEHRRKVRDEAAARHKAELQTYMEEVTAAMERDGYRCTVCGATTNLRVISDGTALKTVCASCQSNAEIG